MTILLIAGVTLGVLLLAAGAASLVFGEAGARDGIVLPGQGRDGRVD